MITGRVNSKYEMRIKLPVRNVDGQEQDVEAVLDSGFTGSLTLPLSLIAKLKLPLRSRSSATLANGNSVEIDVFAAIISWDGTARSILVQAIENVPLLGMALLVDHQLRAQVKVDGLVEIEPIS